MKVVLYSLARKISAERLFKKRYNKSYDWYIKSEHINLPNEIIALLKKKFRITKKSFFPTYLPLIFCNLCIGLILKKKMKKKNAIVTGCAGFIGSNLVDSLLNQNYHVIGIDNLRTGNLKNLRYAKNNKNFTLMH